MQKQKVNVKMQMLYAIIPIVNLWAAHKIEKLAIAFLIFVAISLAIGILVPFPFSIPVILVIQIFIMGKWSKDWNKAIDTASYSSNQ
jgi:hypothetical protein